MTALVALPPLTAAPARGPLLAARGAQLLKAHRPDLACDVTLLIELGARAYGALAPAIPPAVARHLAAGDRRAAAESLAHYDNRGEVAEVAVTVALAWIAPHLTAEDRALVYGEDLLPWVGRRQVADDMGAPWDEVDVDPDAEVGSERSCGEIERMVDAATLLADARCAVIPVVWCDHCGQALPSDHEHTLLALRARLNNQLLTATYDALAPHRVQHTPR